MIFQQPKCTNDVCWNNNFNALRNSGARPGDVVAILGIGGLGHLGIQFSNKMGFKTIAIERGKDKEEMAKKLGVYNTLTIHSECC